MPQERMGRATKALKDPAPKGTNNGTTVVGAHWCKEKALGTLCFQPAWLPLSCYFKQECSPSRCARPCLLPCAHGGLATTAYHSLPAHFFPAGRSASGMLSAPHRRAPGPAPGLPEGESAAP